MVKNTDSDPTHSRDHIRNSETPDKIPGPIKARAKGDKEFPFLLLNAGVYIVHFYHPLPPFRFSFSSFILWPKKRPITVCPRSLI